LFVNAINQFKGKGKEVTINARKEAKLKSDVSGSWLEIDIFIPELNLAFEYQVHSIVLLSYFLSLSFSLSNLMYVYIHILFRINITIKQRYIQLKHLVHIMQRI